MDLQLIQEFHVMSLSHICRIIASPRFLSTNPIVMICFVMALACAFNECAQSQTNTGILKSVSCSTASMTGAGTDVCTILLKYPAEKTPLAANVSSSNAAVSVPSTVSIPAGKSSGTFAAKVTAVTTAQTATIAVKAWNSPVTFSIQV